MNLAQDDNVPDLVDDSEEIARTYQKRRKGNPKRIRWQDFCASKRPFEISVYRTRYCAPWREINPEKRRVALLLVVTVRKELPEVKVVSAKPPPEHAHIEVIVASDQSAPESKSELQEDVDLFEKHQKLCTRLADLAWSDDVPANRC